ncbi:hypothetical protein BDY19DRAFT_168519 [Irpex rosettiformis]|uniref:Uncharacterized protein n=1 Tax=Irpex rosettiformis TaxID=378272 RepID=A0ACB8U2I4_9APHY|nr:hypothetical protein BDY19DRAFT_168519 [Irpex rosettiformis]
MPRLIVHWFSSMVFNILVCYSVMKKLLAMPLFKNTDNRELSDVLLRDVKVMLIAIVFLHIANLLMLVFFPYWNAINWAFSSIADIILTSRLLFNLREVLVSKACQCAGDDEPQLPLYKDLPPPPVYSSTSVKKPFTDSSFTSLKQSSA